MKTRTNRLEPLQVPEGSPARRSRRSSPRRRGITWSALLAFLVAIGAPTSAAQEVSAEQMKGLDEQVQEIKSDVLGIASELDLLEEKLLYPSNTQLAVFVSLSQDATLRLDSAQIRVDGQVVARHVYSFKELEALQKGGVQRIYTGNVPTGEHSIEVSMAGKLPGGEDFSGSESFGFHKGVEPKLVGITLAEQGEIRVGGW